MADGNGPFEKFLRREWREERAQGHTRFIWLRRGIPLGLSVGLVIAGWLAYTLVTRRTDYSTAQVLLLAYAVAAVAIAIAAFEGHIEWTKREREYREQHWRPGFQKRCVDAVRDGLRGSGIAIQVPEIADHGGIEDIQLIVGNALLRIRARDAMMRRRDIAMRFQAEDYESEQALVGGADRELGTGKRAAGRHGRLTMAPV